MNSVTLTPEEIIFIKTRNSAKQLAFALLFKCYQYSYKIIDDLKSIPTPIINKIAQLSAIESLKDSEFIKKSVKHNLNWSIKIKKFLKINNINTNKISANFFLLDFDNCKRSAKYVAKKLEKKRIILRSMENYKMKNKLRMTIGSSIENRRFIKEVDNILR